MTPRTFTQEPTTRLAHKSSQATQSQEGGPPTALLRMFLHLCVVTRTPVNTSPVVRCAVFSTVASQIMLAIITVNPTATCIQPVPPPRTFTHERLSQLTNLLKQHSPKVGPLPHFYECSKAAEYSRERR